jgi:hypothetical protein
MKSQTIAIVPNRARRESVSTNSQGIKMRRLSLFLKNFIDCGDGADRIGMWKINRAAGRVAAVEAALAG